MLLDAAKCQGYSFYGFWVIKEKPTGEGKITPTQIRVKERDHLTFLHEVIAIMLNNSLTLNFVFHRLGPAKKSQIRR